MQIRQGDVLLESSRIPKDAKEKDKVLAYGEATGHAHVIGEGARAGVAAACARQCARHLRSGIL